MGFCYPLFPFARTIGEQIFPLVFPLFPLFPMICY